MSMHRRKWVYVLPPRAFEVAPCACGNVHGEWSEYENHVWCDRCQKDFIPDHYGILQGPIPMHLATLMGVSFDRINLETDTLEKFNIKTGQWEKEKCHEERGLTG